ncbi:adenylate/guanylate cyclase domain-containing protein [Alteromonas sp. ASW11-36]|uniref:Adenylate/guanylate cyclase domain-containing protein n=1 Tax=Alteromonas arenosi TaxID=3055817 RepID=A0ABT7SWL0_9ALTE|nr:adenylate/guanylate cyclase domain-containing protein [Alteromonas sp. ASW11-36]MDM7860576.1 adenylate/guanylate cyclase domain-containing protein [Alteromonas sp. ASW11-36]
MSSPHAYVQRQSISSAVQYALLIALIVQIPLASVADKTHKLFIVGFIFLHILALSALRLAHSIGIRNLLLCITYASFIVLSGALWQGDYLAHWFLPVGIVIAVFLFRLQSPLLLLCVVVLFNALFLHAEYQWIQWRADVDESYLKSKGYLNALLMSSCCTFIGVFIRWHLSQFWRAIQSESASRKSALNRVLPECFQAPLPSTQQPKPQHYSPVSVLFFDMRGYTEFAANRDSLAQIQMLDAVYRRFDEICAMYGIERIKTNGDQYIAAAGVPLTYTIEHNNDYSPAVAICLAARQMEVEFRAIANRFGFDSLSRIGIASGKVIAGIIGLFKPCYDLWGLPMLLASRLESNCVAGHINICETTYLSINQQLHCELVGRMELQGLGTRVVYSLTLDR